MMKTKEVANVVDIDKVAVDIKPSQPPAQPVKKQKTEEELKMEREMAKSLDKALTFLINSTYLRDSTNKLSEKETAGSGVSLNILLTMDHYFPDNKFEHPLIGLTISSAMLAFAVIGKKPIQRKKKNEISGSAEPSGEENRTLQSYEELDIKSSKSVPDGVVGSGTRTEGKDHH